MSNTEKELQNLVNICEDAREFYSDAIEQTNDPEKKRLFRTMADIRKSIIIDLRGHMRQKDMEIKDPTQTLGGQMNKFLGEAIAKWSDNTDSALITYLEEAEDRCLNSFKDIANDNDVAQETRILISQKLETLKKTHDYMKALKETIKSAA